MLLNPSKHLAQGVILWTLCITTFQVLFAEPTIPQKNYYIQGISGSLKKLIDKRLKEIPFNSEISIQIRAAECKQTIHQILEAYGYFQPDIQSSIKATPLGDHITYTISKGPRLLMTQLTIQVIGEGESNPAIQKTVKNLSAQTKSAMTTENYQSIKEALYQSAIAEGYLDATWKKHTVAIDLENYTAVVTLIVDTKPRYTIGPIQILKNNSLLSKSFIKSYLGIKKGSPYQLKQLLKLQTLLRNSDYFQEALIETPATHGNYQIPLHVTVKPAPKYYTLLSLGFRSDLGLRVKAEGLTRYLNPKGHQLSGMLETSRSDFHVLGLYKIPGTSPATQQHHIQLEYKGHQPSCETGLNASSINAYLPTALPTENPNALLRYLFIQNYFNWKFKPFISLYYERFKLTDNHEIKTYKGLIPGVHISKEKAQWGQDPHNYKLNLQTEFTPFASTSFLKCEAKGVYFGYLSPWVPSSYLILRGRYGKLLTENLSNIPTSLRFHAGGYDYPRGHKKHLLGAHTLESGIEIRLHLIGLLYLNPFFDLNCDIGSKSTTRGSTGVGICLWYPHIGNIEISSVYRINPGSSEGSIGLIAKMSTRLE